MKLPFFLALPLRWFEKGIAAARLGASSVVLTDLSENLPLLRSNAVLNEVSDVVSVEPLEWGCTKMMTDGWTCFDVVLATDVLYDALVIHDFVWTLQSLADSSTSIFLAYGRNRQAEGDFFREASKWFSILRIEPQELDEVYQCIDVDVYALSKRRMGSP